MFYVCITSCLNPDVLQILNPHFTFQKQIKYRSDVRLNDGSGLLPSAWLQQINWLLSVRQSVINANDGAHFMPYFSTFYLLIKMLLELVVKLHFFMCVCACINLSNNEPSGCP